MLRNKSNQTQNGERHMTPIGKALKRAEAANCKLARENEQLKGQLLSQIQRHREYAQAKEAEIEHLSYSVVKYKALAIDKDDARALEDFERSECRKECEPEAASVCRAGAKSKRK